MNEISEVVIPVNGDITDNTIKIRKARPEIEDGVAYAQFLNIASEGFFESMLGTKTDEIIANAFVETNNEYSFENVAMIEYNDEVVGMVSAYTSTEKKAFRKNILAQCNKEAKSKIRMFSVVGKLLSRFLGPIGDNDYYIQGIAVDSKIRGKGLGQKLMNYCREVAIQKGAKTLSLDVSSKNKVAIKSYYKFGMEIASQWPNFLKLPSIFTRMVKKL